MQGFILPELIIESIIRDGISNIKANPRIIESVFAQLTRAYASRKYGEVEIEKIKDLILKKEIAVSYSYFEVDAQPYSYTIMVGSDREAKGRTHLGDDYAEFLEQITDPVELEELIKAKDIEITSYNAITGEVKVSDATNLAKVYARNILQDSLGNEFEIIGGINGEPGQKSFYINKNQVVDITGLALIKSQIDSKLVEIKGTTSDINIIIGVHTKDALTTKYLYVLLKYFILSRKEDLISRGIYVATYDGSDFNRDSQFIGDRVYSRFLTISGKIDDTWRSDEVDLIDSIDLDANPKDCLKCE